MLVKHTAMLSTFSAGVTPAHATPNLACNSNLWSYDNQIINASLSGVRPTRFLTLNEFKWKKWDDAYTSFFDAVKHFNSAAIQADRLNRPIRRFKIGMIAY